MAKIALTDVLADPAGVARTVATLDCVDDASVLRTSKDRVTLQVVLLPYDPTGVFVADGYPIESVNVVIRSNGKVHAIPKSGKGRRWKHRYGRTDLCLWYPGDPAELRWTWDDGLEEYIRIVSRHLIYEEYWRRTGEWPVEDAPHGDPPGARWPVQTPKMRLAAQRSRRE